MNLTSNRLASALCLLTSVATVPAHAGQPLLTDDAGVLARGECEFEAGAERLSAGGAKVEGTGLAVACGVGWRSQVGLELARTREAGDDTDAGALAGKTTLWQGGTADDAPALALAWALGWARGGGSGWQRASTDLALVYTVAVGPELSLHANLGHGRDHVARAVSTGWGLALEHAEVEVAGLSVAPMAELFGDDREAPWWNAGLRVALVADRAWLGLGYGRQMDSQRASLASLGLKIAF